VCATLRIERAIAKFCALSISRSEIQAHRSAILARPTPAAAVMRPRVGAGRDSGVAPDMKYDVRFGIVATLAFVAGVSVARLPLPAHAATAPLQPQTIDTAAMTAADYPKPSATFPNLLSKTVVVADGMTAAVQTGNAFKHYHADANEIQIILEGSGTEWLGDHQVNIKPGSIVVIPKGTAHGGTKPDSRPFKAISIKTPPQAPDDTKLLN